MRIQYRFKDGEVKVDEHQLEKILEYRDIHITRDVSIVSSTEINLSQVVAKIVNFERNKIKEWCDKAESLFGRARLAVGLVLAFTIFAWPYLFLVGNYPFVWYMQLITDRVKEQLAAEGYSPVLYFMRYAADVPALIASIITGFLAVVAPVLITMYYVGKWKRRAKQLLAHARKLERLVKRGYEWVG